MTWRCPFCDGDRHPTKEHVFPEWLLEELGLTKTPTKAIHQTISGQAKNTRSMNHGGMVLGKVCGDCNNGWMSELEAAARPVLLTARRKEPLQTLDAQLLATWAFKTAIVLNRWSNYRRLVPTSHFRWLKEHSTPAHDTVVDLGYLAEGWDDLIEGAGSELGYLQSMIQAWTVPQTVKADLPQLVTHLQEQSYVIIVHVESCALRVAHCPLGGMAIEPALGWGHIHRIWPIREHGVMKLDELQPFESSAHLAADIRVVPHHMLENRDDSQ